MKISVCIKKNIKHAKCAYPFSYTSKTTTLFLRINIFSTKDILKYDTFITVFKYPVVLKQDVLIC